MSPSTYGPRIVGKKAFKDAEEADEAGSEARYGTRVRGPNNVPGPRVTGEGEEEEKVSGNVTIADLKRALADNPEFLDAAIEAELNEKKPRKGALEHFISLEEERDEPREELVGQLKAELETHYGEPATDEEPEAEGDEDGEE